MKAMFSTMVGAKTSAYGHYHNRQTGKCKESWEFLYQSFFSSPLFVVQIFFSNTHHKIMDTSLPRELYIIDGFISHNSLL